MTLAQLPPNTPALLRAAGLHVVEISGWQNRRRPARTGVLAARGVLWHHTGSGDKIPNDVTDDRAYAEWLANVGRDDLPPPLCQLSIGRDGTVYVVAAGRANHAGKAKASGPMPAGDGNTLYVGVEIQNNGTEGYGKPQYDAMVKVGVVLSREIVKCVAAANRAHKETSVTGKWDPGALSMPRFREDIDHGMIERKPPPMNHRQKGRVLLEQLVAVSVSALAEYRQVQVKGPRVQMMLVGLPPIIAGARRLLASAPEG